MIVVIALLAQAAATPSTVARATTTPPPAVVTATDASAPTAEGLDDLRRSFHESCEVRLYGEYDDLCSGLADEIRRYRSALQRSQRRAPPR